MKNNNIIINAIMALAIIALYIINFTDNKKPSAEENISVKDSNSLSVAFVKVDSIIYNYVLAQNLTTDFKQKQETYNKTYTEKRLGFEKEAAAFQEKIQRGAFLTQERALQERNRLLTKEQEIKKLDYELSNELAEMQAKINQQIVDSLASFLKIYNAEKKYDLILNSTGLLDGNEGHNITREITDELNNRFELHANK
jgi:outer membrane protein